MRDAVITAAIRTPIGKRNGGLADVHAADLSALVLNELITRTGIEPTLVDDVHWGNVISIGQQSGNVGRMAVLAPGWPETIPGFTIDRQCGSSQQAISTAAATVISGQADVIVAGGVEMMSGVPMGAAVVPGTGELGGAAVARYAEQLQAPGFNGMFNQGAGAELIDRFAESSEACDVGP
jgi:acetyl-CoA acyltransferase